jgi:hypothetical protein
VIKEHFTKLWLGLAVGAIVLGLSVGITNAVVSEQRSELARPKPWRQCAAGTVPVLGKTLSGTVCVPGTLVAGDEVQ